MINIWLHGTKFVNPNGWEGWVLEKYIVFDQIYLDKWAWIIYTNNGRNDWVHFVKENYFKEHSFMSYKC